MKDHWKKLAERRRNLKRGGNTLNANFRKNFLEMQKLMKEKEDSERQDTDSVTGEIRVNDKISISEPRHEKTCLRGLRLGKTQTGLRSQRS